MKNINPEATELYAKMVEEQKFIDMEYSDRREGVKGQIGTEDRYKVEKEPAIKHEQVVGMNNGEMLVFNDGKMYRATATTESSLARYGKKISCELKKMEEPIPITEYIPKKQFIADTYKLYKKLQMDKKGGVMIEIKKNCNKEKSMKRLALFSLVVANLAFANPLDEVGNTIDGVTKQGQDLYNQGKGIYDSTIGKAVGVLDSILGGSLSGINSNLDKLNKVLDKVQGSPIGQCYTIPQAKLDICSLIPDMEAGFDVCSLAPNLPGLQKKSKRMSQDTSPLKAFCENKEKYTGIGGVGNTDTSILTGGSSEDKKPSYDMPGGKGSLDRIIKTKSSANTALMQNDQSKLNLIKTVGDAKGKNLEDVTIEDVVATAPKDIKEYTNKRDILVNAEIKFSIENSPYRFAKKLSNKVGKISGNDPSSIVSSEVNEAHRALTTETIEIMKNELSRAFNDEFLATPTREYIDILRQDIKVKNVEKINNQMLSEANIVKDIKANLEKKKDLISLTAEKVVIMNTVFDVASARAEVEALIR